MNLDHKVTYKLFDKLQKDHQEMGERKLMQKDISSMAQRLVKLS